VREQVQHWTDETWRLRREFGAGGWWSWVCIRYQNRRSLPELSECGGSRSGDEGSSSRMASGHHPEMRRKSYRRKREGKLTGEGYTKVPSNLQSL